MKLRDKYGIESMKRGEYIERLTAENAALRKVIEDTYAAQSKAFEVMNWYASGDHLERWGRTDPQAVLGEVYMLLAQVHAELEAASALGVNKEK